MDMKIVVVGGTGLIGSKLVEKLGGHGHEAVVAAPDTGVNTLTREGLAEVLKGAQAVVDVTDSPSYEADAVMKFFQTSTGNLLTAEKAAGVVHHVVLSIVGTEQMPDNDYFRAKVAQEQLVEQSTITFSIVHATQFFEFAPSIADAATDGNEVRIPPVRFQPVAAEDAAQILGRVAAGRPLNGRTEVGGPEQFQMDEFFRDALAAWGDPREVVTDPQARYFGGLPGERTMVPADGATLGTIRYRDWLSQNPVDN